MVSWKAHVVKIASVQEVNVSKLVFLQIFLEAHLLVWFKLERPGKEASGWSLVGCKFNG